MSRHALPAAGQVLALPADLVRVVPREYEDANGHMNIRHYFGLQAEGMRSWFARMRFPEPAPGRGTGPFTLEQHLRYHRETLVGHELSLHVRLLGRTDTVIHQVGILVNRTTRQIANTCEVMIGHVDLATRRMTPFPTDIATTLDAELRRHAALDWPPPRFAPVSLPGRTDPHPGQESRASSARE